MSWGTFRDPRVYSLKVFRRQTNTQTYRSFLLYTLRYIPWVSSIEIWKHHIYLKLKKLRDINIGSWLLRYLLQLIVKVSGVEYSWALVPFLTDSKKKGSTSDAYAYMLVYVLCLSANFSVTTGPIFVKLIAFSLASINLGHGERIIKIG